MAEPRRSPLKARKTLVIAASLVLLAVLAVVEMARLYFPDMRTRIIRALEDRFESSVELKSFSLSIFPRLEASGEGLVLRYRSRTDIPPLFAIKKFAIHSSFVGLLRSPRRLHRVQVEGLEIHIPPKGSAARAEFKAGARGTGGGGRAPAFIVEEIVADGAHLEILPKSAEKQPLIFEIHRLNLKSVGVGRPLAFDAHLSNPKPPGMIDTHGGFGPWNADEPGETPVSGSYTFKDADLSVFEGIAGMLSSRGDYTGALEHLAVVGTTDIPDFTVRLSGQPVHLTTEFNAVVDGTNGDTYLEPITAKFLNTTLVARGKVEGTRGVKGKTVALKVAVEKARLEDLMRLAVKSEKPPMTGGVQFNTQFELPPGDGDVVKKLRLQGRFSVNSAQFTDSGVQEKIAGLSRRGRGQPKEDSQDRVASDLKGDLALRGGTARFSSLSFEVPGARVKLDGDYNLDSGVLDFRGTLSLQAKLSQTTTGIKSFLLKAVDPLFKRGDAGAVIPIRIVGQRTQPQFKLDVGRVFKRKD